jgi:hypothetical protein
LAVRLLKDPTPLLDVYLAFPFLATAPDFRYEGCLAVLTPVADYLPGAYWDAVAVQNWVRVAGPSHSVVWSSAEAPIVSLGELRPGYVSPAHSCRVPVRAHHPPAGPETLSRGWIYSLLFANNFGTNFAVSQSGSVLFRYALTSGAGALADAEAARLGWEALLPCPTIFTEPRREGHLPLAGSLLSLHGGYLALLGCKHAEDGRGVILRFWNPVDHPVEATVEVGWGLTGPARLTSVTEEDEAPDPGAELVEWSPHGFRLRVGAQALATVRLPAPA